MARLREFDVHKVLGESARVFARYGYAAASIDQLVRATGLMRGSLYGAFSSKAGLFRQSLEYCLESDDKLLLQDLLIVALWERAAIDKEVGRLCEAAIDVITADSSRPIEDMLYHRMLSRAQLTSER